MNDCLKKELNLLAVGMLSSILTILFLAGGFFIANHLIIDKVSETFFDYKANNVNGDIVVDLIAEKCNTTRGDKNKVYCVYNVFSKYFNYVEHVDGKIKTPTLTLIEGGVCRDAATYFCAAYSKMGLSCKSVTTDQHIFVLVDFKKGKYCTVDMADVSCNF